MNRETFTVHVAFLYGDGPMVHRFKLQNVPVHVFRLTALTFVQTTARIIHLLCRERFELVHAYGLRLNLWLRILCWACRVPVFVTGQRSVDGNRKALHSWVDRITSPFVDCYIANSRAAAQMLIQRERVAPAKVRVVYNGLDVSNFSNYEGDKHAFRRGLGITEDQVVIGTLANLRPVKGIEVLLEAFALIREKNTGSVLVIGGDGPLRKNLQRRVSDLRLSQVVHFVGHVDDVPGLLHSLDVFCLASYWEGMPGAVMEAMACSLPVVATDVGGVSELVADGESGFLVPPGNPATLADSVLRLIENPSLRTQLGQAGALMVRQGFSIERMVGQTEAIYHALVSSKQRG